MAFNGAPSTPRRVLVVDDEPSIVDAVATAFRYEGYEVEQASTGREALEMVIRGEPDLIVLDWMLPDIEGIEVGRRLRARGFRTAVLFLTAKDATENKVEALRVGGDDYVTKPFSLAEGGARAPGGPRRRPARRRAHVPRPHARRGPPRGDARGRVDFADGDGVQPAPVLHAQPEARALQGPDPPERVALRLRRQRQRGGDLRQLPPTQARRDGAAADQDGPAGGIHARRAAGVIRRLSLKARLILGVSVLAGVGLAVADVATHASVRSFLYQRVDQSLAASHGLDRCQGGGPGGQGPPIQSFGGGDTFARLVTSAGATLCNLGPQETASPPQWPSTAGLHVGDDNARYDTVSSQDGGTRFRVRTELEPGGGAVLHSAASLSGAEAHLRRLLGVERLGVAAVV